MTLPAHLESLGARFFKKPQAGTASVDVSGRVKQMLNDIRANGIEAARRYSQELDQWSPESFRCSAREIATAVQSLDGDLRGSLAFALGNIRRFATEQPIRTRLLARTTCSRRGARPGTPAGCGLARFCAC